MSNTTATVELGDGEPTRVVTEIPERDSLTQDEKKQFQCLYGFVQNTGIDLLPIHNSWRGDNEITGYTFDVDPVPQDGRIIEGIPADSPTDYGGLINLNSGTLLKTEENELDQYASNINNQDVYSDGDTLFGQFPAETTASSRGGNPVNRNPRAYCEDPDNEC
ncbi:hypothetical protein [Halorhabdus sp. CUG00001]|uniref:hypothetical protein n=1 Tax=Halorhabdus sp. CUG00001 TaxID=2600297 RepID=UPI00131E22B3|nr:hypothetical protein [Halorhabdus sp. CUG00001]